MNTIYIFGPFNTGNNLIINILKEKNFNINYIIDKHTLQPDIIKKVCESSNHYVIFLYKPIYNWLASIKKAPYFIEYQENNRIKLWDIRFNDIIELYHYYYSMYQNFLELFPQNTIYLNYYNLIDELNGYDYLNQKLQKFSIHIERSIYVSCLSQPSKNHGKSVSNSIEALSKRNQNEQSMKEEYKHLSFSLNHSLYSFFSE